MHTFLSSYIMVLVVGLLVLAMFLIKDNNRGNERWFSPLRWAGLGFLVLFVIQPFNHLYFNQVTMDMLDPDVFDPMAFACILSAGGFILGWFFASHTSVRANDGLDVSGRTGSPPHAESKLGLTTLALLGAVSAYYLLDSYHGMESFIQSEKHPGEVMGTGINIFSWMFSSLMVFGLLGLCSTRTWWSWTAVISVLALLVFTFLSLKMGARSRILCPFLGCLALLAARAAPQSFRLWASILSILSVVFIFAFGLIRYEFTYSSDLDSVLSHAIDTSESVYQTFFMSGDFDAFENGMQVVRSVPDQQDFLYGETLLSVLYNPIPRTLWPDKPSPSLSSVLKTTSYGRGGSELENFACSLPAELYANFGWAGVVIGMIVLGYISARVYKYCVNSSHRDIAMIHLGFYSSNLVLLLRGSFHVVAVTYLGILSWIWLCHLLTRASTWMERGR
jgi:oligosaccharide repeat unit polymerase